MFQFHNTRIEGVMIVDLPCHLDERGSFLKTYHAEAFRAKGVPFEGGEDFVSVSHRNVIRGFHVMAPPREGLKLVYVVHGEVLDVVLDVRTASPTYGTHLHIELSAEKGRALLLAPGIAHGFLSMTDVAVVGYKSQQAHAPAQDLGIRWDSIGMTWPVQDPILSVRDQQLPALSEFVSPF